MEDWGDKILNYQEMKNNPDAFKFRNPIIFLEALF